MLAKKALTEFWPEAQGTPLERLGAVARIKMFHIINIKAIFVENKQQTIMTQKKQVVFPKHQKILEQVGENIKLARKRRKLTTLQVAERAGIDRTTLYHIEKGKSSVSVAAYFNTLRVLGLQDDFLKLAADDDYGRKLQDLNLIGTK
jgi:DNA-binding XRE family transcriptional regulator